MRTSRDSCSASLIASLAVVAFLLATPALGQDCPELVGSLPGFPWDLAVSGGYAYVADYDGALDVVDVSTPSAPVEVGSLEIGGRLYEIAVSGGFAYVTSGLGLHFIDVSSPSAPVEVAFLSGVSGGSVAVSSNYVYLAGGGLYVIDPTVPVVVGFLDPPGHELDVAVAGSYAYLMSASTIPFVPGRLGVIDVSTPSNPVEVGSVEGPGRNDVAVSGGYAYVTKEHKGTPSYLAVIDVNNPSAPVEMGYLPLYDAQDVAVSGHYAYVADGDGLRVADVSTPSAPVEVGFYPTGEYYATGVAVSDGYVFLAASTAGLYVFRECSFFSDGFESGDTSAWSATVP